MICPNCSFKNSADANFCRQCGTALKKEKIKKSRADSNNQMETKRAREPISANQKSVLRIIYFYIIPIYILVQLASVFFIAYLQHGFFADWSFYYYFSTGSVLTGSIYIGYLLKSGSKKLNLFNPLFSLIFLIFLSIVLLWILGILFEIGFREGLILYLLFFGSVVILLVLSIFGYFRIRMEYSILSVADILHDTNDMVRHKQNFQDCFHLQKTGENRYLIFIFPILYILALGFFDPVFNITIQHLSHVTDLDRIAYGNFQIARFLEVVLFPFLLIHLRRLLKDKTLYIITGSLLFGVYVLLAYLIFKPAWIQQYGYYFGFMDWITRFFINGCLYFALFLIVPELIVKRFGFKVPALFAGIYIGRFLAGLLPIIISGWPVLFWAVYMLIFNLVSSFIIAFGLFEIMKMYYISNSEKAM